MTSIRSLLHQIAVLLFVFMSLLFLNTCKEDAPTEPEGNNNNGNVLTSSTIGPSGGELKTDDFSLTVRSGSFQNESTLSLSFSDNDSPFGESSVTSIYRVEGIPKEFNNSITVTVKYNGTLLDSSYLAIGEPLGGSDIEDIYFLIPAVDSSGYLVGNLAASDYPKNYLFKNNDTNTELEDLIIGLKGIGSYSNSLFRINYPKYISENSIIDFSHLTIDCGSVIGTDFKFIKLAELFFKPAKIIIRDYKDNRVTRNGNCFNVDVDLIGPSKESLAKIKFTSSLFSSVSYNFYDSDSFLSQIFMTNALILYLEDCLGYTTNNDPPSGIGGEPTDIKGGKLWGLVGNELSFFDGFKGGDYPGFSSVIKYLVNFQNYDVGNFGEIFEEASTKNTNHYYSLISRVDRFIVDWFPDYYEKYIKGEVYNIESSVFLDQENLGIFKTSSDTSLVFTDNYNDLSAKRFVVELNNEFEDELTSLILDAYPSNAANNEGVATLVFSVDASDNLQHIVTARAEPVEIPNLKGYYQNGTKKFLVVVVNCINNGVDYTGVTEIDLKAKIKRKGNTSAIEGYYLCRITSHALYDLLMEKTGSDGSFETETYSSIDVGFEAIIYGDVKNYSFIGNYEEGVISSSVDIRFDNNYENIESISLVHTIENNNEVGNFYYSINADNIPKADWSEGIDCSIIGSNYCNSLQMANYSKSVTYNDGEVTYIKTTTTTGFSCDDMSGINVIFYRQ